jgi:hypothetical protein
LRRWPGCRRSRRWSTEVVYVLAVPGRGGAPAGQLEAVASPDGTLGVTTDRVRILGGQRPPDIRDYTAVRATPLALGAVLVLLAVGTLAQVLITSVRRRQRDLAILKALGLLRAELLGVVCWEATALAAAALLAGLPLGLLAGRMSWALFASSLGVSGTAVIPVPLVLLAIPVTWLLAIIIAIGPGRSAARITPATVLRTE